MERRSPVRALVRIGSTFVLLAAVAASGCVSYRVSDQAIEAVEGSPIVGSPRARIANPELEDEAVIVRSSKLYQVVDQPDQPYDVTLKLSPLRLEEYGCGGGMFLCALTLGIGPGAVHETFTFEFEECETGTRRSVRGLLTEIRGLTGNLAFGFTGREGALGEAVGKVFREGYRLPVKPVPPGAPEGAESRPGS
jgi:hypothetical protein